MEDPPSPSPRPEPTDRIVVRTPDRREYRGILIEMVERDGRLLAIVRLDTGWMTSYPAHMIHRISR